MDLPKRKPTRLPGYDYSQNGAYYITLCTEHRQPILCEISVGDGILDAPKQDGILDVPKQDGILDVPKQDGILDVPKQDGIFDAQQYRSPQIQLSNIGLIVEETIQYINGYHDDITIDHYVIMPNHVHMIVIINMKENEGGTSRMPSPTNTLIPKMISSLKRFTNKRCGIEIWQRSYYDHVIRNEEDYQRIWQYIDENPFKWQEDELYVQGRKDTIKGISPSNNG